MKKVLIRSFSYVLAFSLSLSAASCDLVDTLLNRSKSGVQVQIVVGTAYFTRDVGPQPLAAGQMLSPRDAVTVLQASKLRVGVGAGNIFVNQDASFRVISPAESENAVVAVERGEYYFTVRGGVTTARFGDMAITMSNTDALLAIDGTGRLAVFFVLNGRASVKRGSVEKRIAACQGVVLDAAGISEDEVTGKNLGNVIRHLKDWVGETVIDRAVAAGGCAPQPVNEADVDTDITVVPYFPAPATAAAPRTAAAVANSAAATPAPAADTASADIAADDTLAVPAPKREVTVKLVEKQGADPRGNILINAGGPYKAMRNRPVRLRGNARARYDNIVQYEWRFTSAPVPEFVSDTNFIAYFTYLDAGRFSAIFTVRLSDGTSASDTAIVTVGSLVPVANAGADIVSRAGRRVRLNGTGTSPDGGRIVRYEWDFDGDGVFDWSSERTGAVEHTFRVYSHPVFRVTDGEGNTAYDTMRVIICPKGMVTVAGGKFCIDKYEWPNRRGAVPQTNVSHAEAAAACASAGKRLCAADEWMRACRNDSDIKPADGRSFSYGNNFDFMRCNTLDNPRARNMPAPSGVFNACAGSLQIHDMTGNVSEWVASDNAAVTAPAYGGFFQSESGDSACDSYLMLDKSRAYPYVGFRCCR